MGYLLSTLVIVTAGLAGLLIADYQKNFLIQMHSQATQVRTNWTAFDPSESQKKRHTVEEIQSIVAAIYEQMKNIETAFFKKSFDRTEVDDNYYQGEKNSQGQRHGIGRVVLPNGDSYLGQWRADTRHGVGGVGYSGGEIIVSEWKFDSPHGWGEHVTADGWKYNGQFKAGLPDGQGVQWYGDGSFYLGDFKEGKEHGWGVFEDAKVKHEGEFVNGERHGKAKVTSKSDGKVIFEGRFKNNQPVDPSTTTSRRSRSKDKAAAKQ